MKAERNRAEIGQGYHSGTAAEWARLLRNSVDTSANKKNQLSIGSAIKRDFQTKIVVKLPDNSAQPVIRDPHIPLF